jgi:hypothetical protein
LSDEETMKVQPIVLIGLLVLVILAFMMMSRQVDTSLDGRVARDRARDVARFLPENSVDISMAMKIITHDPPSMLNPPANQPPLLLYPPSEDTLARLSG